MTQQNQQIARTLIAAAMMLLVSTMSARSQNISTDSAILSKLADGTEAMFGSLQLELLKKVPDQYQLIAKMVRFRIDRENFGIAVYATKDQSRGREVVFSLGAVQALDAINRSYAEVMARHPLTTRARISARALLFAIEMTRLSRKAQDIISAGQAGQLGASISEVPSYCDRIRSPSPNDSGFCEALHQNLEYQQLYSRATTAAYMMVMGHELSHHFLLHAVGDKNFQRPGNETIADKWGMYFTSATSPDLASALNGLILLKLAESWRGPPDPAYPKAACRIRDALIAVSGFTEPSFTGTPPSLADAWSAQAWEVRKKILENMTDDC